MQIKPKHGIFKPKSYIAQMILQEPTLVKEAFKHPEWVEAIEKECKALVSNATWKLILPPKGQKIIRNR